MENNEIKELITTFKEYRDLIGPIEQSLRAFASSFESMRSDIHSLSNDFDGELQTKLDKIYKELSSQADKARTLASQVDKFSSSTAKYVDGVDRLVDLCSEIESRMVSVTAIQKKAEGQIDKLDSIIEEKRKSYDIKGLEKNLESYNAGIEKISEYINKDIAEALSANERKISEIKDKSFDIYSAIVEERGSIDKFIGEYAVQGQLLKKMVENNDVNEAYIFDVLDRWAEARKLKIKK